MDENTFKIYVWYVYFTDRKPAEVCLLFVFIFFDKAGWVLLVVHVYFYKKKQSEEKRASGISPEQDELDLLLEEIMERFEAGDKNEKELSEAGRRKNEKDKAAAEDNKLVVCYMTTVQSQKKH